MNLFTRSPKLTLVITTLVLFIFIEFFSFILLSYYYENYKKKNIYEKFDAHTFFDHYPNILTEFGPWKGLSDVYQAKIPWEFDKYGMVKTPSPFSTKENLKNKKTVVIFGGSTVFGVGSSSIHQTIATQLQNILNEKDSNTLYTVINAGVRGYVAYQEFARYLNDVKYLNPDIIISLNGRNDVYLASKGFLVNDFSTDYSKEIELQINYINEKKKFFSDIKSIIEYSNFVQLLNQVLIKFKKIFISKENNKIFDTNGKNFLVENGESYEVLSSQMLSALDNYIHIMQLFKHSVTLEDKNFFWVLQPTALVEKNLTALEEDRINKIGIKKDYKEMINLSYKYINSESDLVYDASLLFQNSNETLYIDDCHYNNISNFLIAEYLSKLVLSDLSK